MAVYLFKSLPCLSVDLVVNMDAVRIGGTEVDGQVHLQHPGLLVGQMREGQREPQLLPRCPFEGECRDDHEVQVAV